MKLSVVIVNHNVKYFLEQCLLSIRESRINFELEIFVVDNSSTDGSVDYLKPKFEEVQFISNIQNTGFAKANNQAIQLSKGEYVLLLNPDTVLGENVLSNVCLFMDKQNKTGAVGVKMIDGTGSFLAESKRGFPTPWASFCKIFGLSKLFPMSKLFGQYHLKYLDKNKIHKVDVLAGAFMMLRKEVLDKVGLLDEQFFMYGEDIDLSYRIAQAGYSNYYMPETIIHYKGESTGKDQMRYVKIFYGAMYLFFKKHYPNYGAVYSFFVTLGIGLRASLAYIRRLVGLKKKNRKQQTVLLDHAVYTYEEIIKQMNESDNKNRQYQIYSPASGMIIGTQWTEKETSK